MLDKVKTLIRFFQYGQKASEALYIRHLKAIGMTIGQNVHLYSPWTIEIDEQRPWMISMGDNVYITANCSILQHDYSWSVLHNKTGYVYGACGQVKIGNNVFIGQKSIILKNTHISDNVIIGAGSVVSGCLEGDSVYAGVPARKIMDLDTFKQKRADRQLEEATLLVLEYRRVHGGYPPKQALREFFWLFESRANELDEEFASVNALDGNQDKSSVAFMTSEPLFDGYDQFLQYVERKRLSRTRA